MEIITSVVTVKHIWKKIVDKIDNLKIKGIDPDRPPNLDNNNYIDVIYELTQQAPKDWCLNFNNFFSKERHKTRIDPKQGLYIETWVHDMNEIPNELNLIKQKIKICNEIYIKKLHEDALLRENAKTEKASTESRRLKNIIANLNFD